MRKLLILAAALALAATAFLAVSATEYKVAVPQLAPASTAAYSSLIKAVLEAEGNTASVEVMPFARCLYLMENRQADILSSIVAVPDKAQWPKLKWDYATVETIKIVFVLYSNKDKPVTVAEIKKGNPRKLKLETDAGHVDHFNFPLDGSSNFGASLQKVANGQIDGFLFSQASGDTALKQLALKNIKREYYDTWSGVFVIAKGTRGGAIDKMLSSGMEKIKKNGKYQEIMGKLVAGASTYIDWQP
jgi:polar amino acid transport system substrate-binding protein